MAHNQQQIAKKRSPIEFVIAAKHFSEKRPHPTGENVDEAFWRGKLHPGIIFGWSERIELRLGLHAKWCCYTVCCYVDATLLLRTTWHEPEGKRCSTLRVWINRRLPFNWYLTNSNFRSSISEYLDCQLLKDTSTGLWMNHSVRLSKRLQLVELQLPKRSITKLMCYVVYGVASLPNADALSTYVGIWSQKNPKIVPYNYSILITIG